MSITILNFYPASHPNIKGNFAFRIDAWGLEIKSCRLIKGKNGHDFISFPQYEYEKNGEKKYINYVCFDDQEKEKRLKAKVHEALIAFLRDQVHAPHQPTSQIVSSPQEYEHEDKLPF